MKKIFISILLLLAAMSISAQTVSYTYDNAGNRTERVVSLTTVKNPVNPPIMKSTTSIEDIIAGKAIVVYPNPTKGILNVEIKDYTDQMQADYRIVDMSGKTIFSKKAINGYQTFDLSRQAAGIYLLQIRINGESVIWKIVKE